MTEQNEAKPEGWHVEVKETKRGGTFRPLIMHGETLRYDLPNAVSFTSAKAARRDAEELLNARVPEAREAGRREGFTSGHAQGVEEGHRSGYAEGEAAGLARTEEKVSSASAKARREGYDKGRDAGTTRGFIWGALTVAIIVFIGVAIAANSGVDLGALN